MLFWFSNESSIWQRTVNYVMVIIKNTGPETDMADEYKTAYNT